ncbi:MAG TPA: IS110 family transposase [Planctomycetes bacterium]|nr:IS110 family transposase [Planctomycetota bacterium]
MSDCTTYIAMDTHKKEHKVALHYPGDEQIVRFVVKNTARDIKKMVTRVTRQAPADVVFCYEAGVCGFTLKRRIEVLGCKCAVIAPSLTPIKPGDRVKTDRRDATKLLAMLMAGLLTEVHAPDQKQEAARELTRCRQAAQENLKRLRHQLLKFLTRHGYVYTDGEHWTQKHLRWLRSLEFEQPLLRDVFDSYFTEMQHCIQRLDSLDKQVEQLAQSEPYKETVGLLRCFHGIDTLTAIGIITEIFDFGRFSSPGELMSYLGLTPSESSSGEKQHKGPITKTGNKRVRRLLIEAAWHYRHPYIARSKVLRQRRKDQPQWVIDIADRAGQRLRKRYWHLINSGKIPCKATVAIARELAGFIWSVFREYQIRNQEKAA